MTVNAAGLAPPEPGATHHGSADRLPVMVTAVAVVLAGIIAWISFDALHELAEMCGLTDSRAWLWPLSLDAVAALATWVWVSGGPAWRLGRTIALIAIGLSTVGGGLATGLAAKVVTATTGPEGETVTNPTAPHWTIIVAVGVIPPIMLALVIHMLVVARQRRTGPDRSGISPYTPDRADEELVDDDADTVEIALIETSTTNRTRERSTSADQAGPVSDQPGPDAETDQSAASGPIPDRSDEVIAEAVRKEITKTGKPPSRNSVMTTYRIGAGRAVRVIGLATQDSPVAGPALALVPGPVRPTPTGARDSDREEVAL